MKKICLKANIEDERSQRRIIKAVVAIGGDPVRVTVKLRKLGFRAEVVSIGPDKPEKFEAQKAEKKEGSIWDSENRGADHYLGVRRAEAVGGFGGLNQAIEDNEGSKTRIAKAVEEAEGSKARIAKAVEEAEGSKTRIAKAVEEAVAGFGDFSSIQVDRLFFNTSGHQCPCPCPRILVVLNPSKILLIQRLLCFRLFFNTSGHQKGDGNCSGKISSCQCGPGDGNCSGKISSCQCGPESERNGVQSKAAEPWSCHRRRGS